MTTMNVVKRWGYYRYVCECGHKGRRTATFGASCIQWIAHVNGKHKQQFDWDQFDIPNGPQV